MDTRQPAAPAKPLRILVVDDSMMMRTMLKRTASVSGVAIAEILEASDGREALEVLDRQDVDAVFTDLNMPGMSGLELLRVLAADPRRRDLVRVIISTDDSEARRAETRALGVSHYVGKPARPEAVRDVLAAVAIGR